MVCCLVLHELEARKGEYSGIEAGGPLKIFVFCAFGWQWMDDLFDLVFASSFLA